MNKPVRTFIAQFRTGRRGAILSLLGGIFAIIGYTLITLDAPDALVVNLKLATEVMSLNAWGVVWVVVGAVAIVSAFLPAGADRWGFIALAGMTMWWSCVYFLGWILFQAPRAWAGGLLYIAIAGVVMIAAGWGEYRD